MLTGKSSSSYISSLYSTDIRSSKLGEENARKKASDSFIKIDTSPLPLVSEGSRPVRLKDDEESVIAESSRVNFSCGACRTHDSKKWWKAPKGLVTDMLCDTCGTNWRKYADINVRPLREESVASGKGKREGTPLAGPSAKRMRVCSILIFPPVSC
jgi:hypothetical protein